MPAARASQLSRGEVRGMKAGEPSSIGSTAIAAVSRVRADAAASAPLRAPWAIQQANQVANQAKVAIRLSAVSDE